ncbi:MAG: alpha/beta hydrolase [Hormoscilla sp. SP12CHS1]|nr:alpha/beta hydrolase [Hormoscilla sp. SP12CHS1]
MGIISLKKRLIILRGLAIAYLGIGGLLWWGQQRLLFWPSPVLERTQSKYNLDYEDVWLPVSDPEGNVERIHGWWLPASQPQAPVLLYLHHNAVNIGANVSQAKSFHKLVFSVLLIDYRGFGLSEGDFPDEFQVYRDAEVAWHYLTQKRGIPPQQIFIYGHSLGGAIAIYLAVRHPEAGALIAHNSFTNLRDMTKRFGIFWLFPVDLLLRQKFDSIGKISGLKMPVLFIHGTRDPQIPARMSESLLATAPAPKRLLLIPEGHDNNMDKEYWQEVGKFMQQVQSDNNKATMSPGNSMSPGRSMFPGKHRSRTKDIAN